MKSNFAIRVYPLYGKMNVSLPNIGYVKSRSPYECELLVPCNRPLRHANITLPSCHRGL